MAQVLLQKIDADKCLRCGFCREVCPLYNIKHNESFVARGFVFLGKSLEEGKIDLNHDLSQHINQCLLCTSCKGVCPAGVEIDGLIMELRRRFLEKNGMPLSKKMMLNGLLNRKMLKLSAFFADKTQPLIFKKITGSNAYKMRLPILLENADERIFPSFKRSDGKNEIKVTGNKKKLGKVAYFTGCGSQLFYPDVATQMEQVLNYLGFDVTVPRGQECCGQPLFSSGDINTGKKLLRKNIEILSQLDVDYIVTNCTTCVSILKTKAAAILEKDLENKIKNVAEKVLEFSELAVKVNSNDIKLGPLDLTVSIHDSCHRYFNKDYRNIVRKFVMSIPRVKFIEMDKADRCCGGAGSYNLFNYSNAKNIRKEKLNSIKNANPDIVLCSCLECKRFLTEGIMQESMRQVVMHPVELLAMSILKKV